STCRHFFAFAHRECAGFSAQLVRRLCYTVTPSSELNSVVHRRDAEFRSYLTDKILSSFTGRTSIGDSFLCDMLQLTRQGVTDLQSRLSLGGQALDVADDPQSFSDLVRTGDVLLYRLPHKIAASLCNSSGFRRTSFCLQLFSGFCLDSGHFFMSRCLLRSLLSLTLSFHSLGGCFLLRWLRHRIATLSRRRLGSCGFGRRRLFCSNASIVRSYGHAKVFAQYRADSRLLFCSCFSRFRLFCRYLFGNPASSCYSRLGFA